MEQKKLDSFIGAKDYDSAFDMDVFKEDQVCFFVKVDNDTPFFYEAHIRDDENSCVDYTVFSRTREGDYKSLDGGFIWCKKKPELPVVELLDLSGFSRIRKVNPEDIEYVEPEEMDGHTILDVFKPR